MRTSTGFMNAEGRYLERFERRVSKSVPGLVSSRTVTTSTLSWIRTLYRSGTSRRYGKPSPAIRILSISRGQRTFVASRGLRQRISQSTCRRPLVPTQAPTSLKDSMSSSPGGLPPSLRGLCLALAAVSLCCSLAVCKPMSLTKPPNTKER